jgi:hypothetical protein
LASGGYSASTWYSSPPLKSDERPFGADAALRDLVRTGLLQETGGGLAARLEVDVVEAIRARRRLMSLEPRAVALLQRTGERWAALASTCSKYPGNARMSPASAVASGTA